MSVMKGFMSVMKGFMSVMKGFMSVMKGFMGVMKPAIHMMKALISLPDGFISVPEARMSVPGPFTSVPAPRARELTTGAGLASTIGPQPEPASFRLARSSFPQERTADTTGAGAALTDGAPQAHAPRTGARPYPLPRGHTPMFPSRKRNASVVIASALLAVTLLACAAPPAAAPAPVTPSRADVPAPGAPLAPLPPLDRASELALALEAAPAPIAAKAGVYVLGPAGFESARRSENGFVCIVERSSPAAREPQCLDPEGVRTFLPRILMVASLRTKGKTEPEIRAEVKAAFASGALEAPRRPGVDYMLSPHNVVTVDVEKGIAVPFPPHLMFYAPNMGNSDIGSDGSPASPVFVVNEKSPHALMIVPVPTGGAGMGHSHAAPSPSPSP
jgi:hypothetical protein